MGCMKLCGCFHITPEGRDLLSLVVLVPILVPVSVPVLLSVNMPSDSKPDAYIVLCRKCPNYTKSDPFFLFIHSTGI